MIKLLFICGKGGTGKDSVVNQIIRDDMFERLALYTTRPLRDGEVDGNEYKFVTRERFEELVNDDIFSLVEKYPVIEDEYFYGIPKFTINDDKIYVVCGPRSQFIQLKKDYGDMVFGVYLYNDAYTSLNRMISRLRIRDDRDVVETCRRVITDYEDFKGVDTSKYNLTIDTGRVGVVDEVHLVKQKIGEFA